MDRRKLLSLSVQGIGLVAAGVIAVPAVMSGINPARKEQPEELWIPVGSVQDFLAGAISKVGFSIADQVPDAAPAEKSIYVWRRGEDEFVVYSRACTDLGCPLNYDPNSEAFYCPCHGGIFSKEGERLAGPPNRPMWRYDNRVREGLLEINLFSVPIMI